MIKKIIMQYICFSTILLIYCNTFSTIAIASNKNDKHEMTKNVPTTVDVTKSLLDWMQNNLNKQTHFTSEDLKQFFAEKFIIDTNGKIVNATPVTYHDYLYNYKSHLTSVHYDIEYFINSENYVVVPFIINIKNMDSKLNQRLRVIAIFKFDKKGKIRLWKEVFTKI